MKKYSTRKYFLIAALGLIILITGLVLIKWLPDAEGTMKVLPFICVGAGAGIFGGSLGTAIKNYILNKNQQVARQVEIEKKDERNITINNKSKAKAFDLMVIVFGALLLIFALMQVDVYAIILFVAAYLFIISANIYYLVKNQKEM